MDLVEQTDSVIFFPKDFFSEACLKQDSGREIGHGLIDGNLFLVSEDETTVFVHPSEEALDNAAFCMCPPTIHGASSKYAIVHAVCMTDTTVVRRVISFVGIQRNTARNRDHRGRESRF
jgi:hypothetical protein